MTENEEVILAFNYNSSTFEQQITESPKTYGKLGGKTSYKKVKYKKTGG